MHPESCNHGWGNQEPWRPVLRRSPLPLHHQKTVDFQHDELYLYLILCEAKGPSPLLIPVVSFWIRFKGLHMHKKILMAIILVCLPATLLAQSGPVDARSTFSSSLLRTGKQSKFSLLDPAKVSMSHQYSMLFGAGNLGSRAAGIYQNTISYKFSPSMLLNVNVDVVHQLKSSGSNSISQRSQNSRVVPGFDFTYKPTRNMIFHVSYGMATQTRLNGRSFMSDPTWFGGTTTTSAFSHPMQDQEENVRR